jgi:hypothetical protein
VIYRLALGSERYRELLKETKSSSSGEDRFDVSKIEIKGENLEKLNKFKEFIKSQVEIGNESQKLKKEYFEFEGEEIFKNPNLVNKNLNLVKDEEKNTISRARQENILSLEEKESLKTAPSSTFPSSTVQPKSFQLLRQPQLGRAI